MISKTRRTRRTHRNRILKSRKIYGGKNGEVFKWDLGVGVIIYKKEGYIFDDYWIEYTPPKSDRPLKFDWRKLGWKLHETIPMLTSQTYGIDNFLKKVFFIQSEASVVYNPLTEINQDNYNYDAAERGAGQYDDGTASILVSSGTPFWKPFSENALDTIQKSIKADDEFIKLRDAIRKFSAEHDDLTRLTARYSDDHSLEENRL